VAFLEIFVAMKVAKQFSFFVKKQSLNLQFNPYSWVNSAFILTNSMWKLHLDIYPISIIFIWRLKNSVK